MGCGGTGQQGPKKKQKKPPVVRECVRVEKGAAMLASPSLGMVSWSWLESLNAAFKRSQKVPRSGTPKGDMGGAETEEEEEGALLLPILIEDEEDEEAAATALRLAWPFLLCGLDLRTGGGASGGRAKERLSASSCVLLASS